VITIYDFAVQTLLNTLVDLGADYALAQDQSGQSFILPTNRDQWMNEQLVNAISRLANGSPVIGTRLGRWTVQLGPLRVFRLSVIAVPGGYVATALNLQSALSNLLARRLADEIENFINRSSAAWAPRFPSTFYPGLSRRY